MNQSSRNNAKVLGIFSLAMITAGSVDSIRNLPATALFGESLIFFFIIAALLFLLPSALVASELASTSDEHGGVYVWVKNAFGQQMGFAAVWFQWIENVIWYPTILSFVAGTIGYLFNPALAQSKVFLISVILTCFWGATLVNLRGIQTSARVANICSMFGLIIPMALIIGLGAVWLLKGYPSQVHFTAHGLLPVTNSHMWVALTGIILSFCGMEIATVHSGNVHNPQKAYPNAMLLATVIIFFTLICGALAIAIVIPEQKISLVAGIMQAFNAFFTAYHMNWILPLIAVMLVIGGMGGVNNWIIAPTRGLLIAAEDGNMPQHLAYENRRGAPQRLLVYQAIIVSFITLVFVIFPTVNAAYWLLTALASQLYMIMYFMMFAAGIRLRYLPHNNRPGFRLPGQWGMWLVASAGILGSAITFCIGFIPPSNIQFGGTTHYELLLITGLLVMSLPPFVMYRAMKNNRTGQGDSCLAND